jgi:hypothetical protein
MKGLFFPVLEIYVHGIYGDKKRGRKEVSQKGCTRPHKHWSPIYLLRFGTSKATRGFHKHRQRGLVMKSI